MKLEVAVLALESNVNAVDNGCDWSDKRDMNANVPGLAGLMKIFADF